jgi:hypothetical protein
VPELIPANGTGSCKLTGLTKATRFEITVAESSLLTNGTSSAPVTLLTPGAPGAMAMGLAMAGNASATVFWSAVYPGWNTTIRYDVVSSGGQTCSSTLAANPSPNGDSPTLMCSVNGLTNGVSYTFAITASNAGHPQGGNSETFTTNAVTPTSAPGAPTGLKFKATSKSAGTFSWKAPTNNGGQAIDHYIMLTDYGKTCKVATTSCSLHGLSASDMLPLYFTVTAVNATGVSHASAVAGPFQITPSLGTQTAFKAAAKAAKAAKAKARAKAAKAKARAKAKAAAARARAKAYAAHH